MKTLTIKELLARKEEIKNRNKKSTQYLYVESLGENIKIEQPSRELCNEALEMANDGEMAKSDTHIVYNCVVEPNLKDPQLQKEFGCVEPTDIVDALFKPGEVASISGHCMELAGYGKGVKKLDSDLKN